MRDLVRDLQALITERQHNRILRLSFPHQDGPGAELLVNSLDAHESVSRDFEYIVELLSNNPRIELKAVLGRLLCVELVRHDGTLRYFTGYCFSFSLDSVDGGVSTYRATLGPWLRYLQLRKNCYLFHNKSVREQTESVFAGVERVAKWEWRSTADEVPMTAACQFNESDHNYLSRRWEAAGLMYWYEHDAKGHTLVITDDSTGAPPIDGDVRVPFQKHGGAVEENGIASWSPTRQSTVSSVALSAFDFKRPSDSAANLSVTQTVNQQGDVLDIESYEYAGAYAFKDNSDADRLGRLRMEEIEATAKHFDGTGNNRDMAPGRWFELTGHFNVNRDHRNEFLVLRCHHQATNNYLQTDQQPHYANDLACTRRTIVWRPSRNFNSIDTRILAPQTATVVGPTESDSIHVDEYGRVRVQFHWDRIGEYDDCSSAWVRVVSMWAGAQLGATAAPRVGSEVCVLFMDGNPDRPIIIAGIPNEFNMPAWSLPDQHALTGLRSRELTPGGGNAAGGRSNHLVLDDTHNEMQAQLRSDHRNSQLSLGRITRIEDNAGRKDARGEGWELATDAWGVARAAKGMLLSTEPTRGHAKDMGQTLPRLDGAQEDHARLADLAMQAGAQESGQQVAACDALKEQNQAIHGKGGDFPELAQPMLVVASCAGIALSSAETTHIATGQHAAVTAGGNVSIASRGGFYASIKQTFRLFVQQAGMKLVAHAGDIDIQALSDNLKLLAKLNISATATRITITAKEELVFNGGGSYAVYNASGIEQGTDGSNVVHANKHSFVGAKNQPPPTIENKQLKPAPDQLHFTLQSHVGGRAMATIPYALFKGGAKIEDGISDDFGRIVIPHESGTPEYSVRLPSGEEFKLKVSPDLAKAGSAEHPEHALSNQGLRALDGTTDGRSYT